MINPFAENKEAQAAVSEDLKNISDESDFDGPLVTTSQRQPIELAGKEKLDDKPVYRLKVRTKRRRTIYLLMPRLLLLKWEGTRKRKTRNFPGIFLFGFPSPGPEIRIPDRPGSPARNQADPHRGKIEIDLPSMTLDLPNPFRKFHRLASVTRTRGAPVLRARISWHAE